MARLSYVLTLALMLSSTSAFALPLLSNGTRFEKTVTSPEGWIVRSCTFDEDFGRFGTTLQEGIALPDGSGARPRFFFAESTIALNPPANYYAILGGVYQARNSYVAAKGTVGEPTVRYTIQYRDSNSQGSDLFYTVATTGAVVGKNSSPLTDSFLAFIDSTCPF